jgi:putative ABC transport system permease protein
MNLVKIAFKNIWRRKIRSCLTVLGISISIAAYVSLNGLASNLKEAFKATYERRETDLIVKEKGTFDFLTSAIDETSVQKIREISGVQSAEPVMVDFYQLKFKEYVLLLGWNTDSYLFGTLKIKGRIPESFNEVILGQAVSDKLKAKLGDKIAIKGASFTITGTFESKSVFEDGSIIMPLGQLQKLKNSAGRINLINIAVKKDILTHSKATDNKKKIELVQARISELFPNFEVKNVNDFMSSDNILLTLTNFALAISYMVFIIAILGITNTMATSVLEQVRELGILLSIGWGKIKIVGLIIYEAMLLAFCGGVLGLALGYWIMKIIFAMPELQNITKIHYDILFMLEAVALSLGIGLLAVIYPAWKAISIEPIKALKYE